jgi:hypothetical protein
MDWFNHVQYLLWQQIPDDLNYIEKGGQAPQGINKEKKKTNEKWHHETFY